MVLFGSRRAGGRFPAGSALSLIEVKVEGGIHL